MDETIFKVLGIQNKITRKGREHAFPSKHDGYLEKRKKGQNSIPGVPTGYHKLDEMTGGLQATDLIIIAARPGMGKTAFALNIAMNAAVFEKVPTAYFSLELSQEKIVTRMLCSWSKVNLDQFQRGLINDEDRVKLHHGADTLYQAPIYIDDGLHSMEDLMVCCRRLKLEKNLGLVMIDYLQLLQASGRVDSLESKTAGTSFALKELAKELKLPVIALSQLKRNVEERNNHRPVIADLFESEAIERNADMIAFIYRDDFYNKQKYKQKRGIAEIIIDKQRNGTIGKVELAYQDLYVAFENQSSVN